MDAEIRELNLTYLMLACRLLRHDRETAKLQLQLTDEMADYLLSLPSSKLSRLADVNQMLFKLRIDESDRLKQLTHNERDQGMGQIHAALMLASSSMASAVGPA